MTAPLKPLKHIVVGQRDLEEPASVPPAALHLAQAHDAQVHLVHVAPKLPVRFWYDAPLSPQELHDTLVEVRTERLTPLVEQLNDAGVRARCVVRVGSPHIELIKEAASVDADLIMVRDEPQPGDSELGFGTVTQKLLRISARPVLAVRGDQAWKPQKIMAAIDVDPWKGEGNDLNRSILQHAARLAHFAGCGLHVVHVWKIWGEHLLRSRGHLTPTEVDALRQNAEDRCRATMESLLADVELDDVEVHLELVRGEPDDAIPKTVHDAGVDLLVMGTVSRSGLAGLVIGNTAERVIHRIGCALLAIKPPDFQSPVDMDP
ncbi:MAG: universal stress protein [Myxococcota bacterium]